MREGGEEGQVVEGESVEEEETWKRRDRIRRGRGGVLGGTKGEEEVEEEIKEKEEEERQ